MGGGKQYAELMVEEEEKEHWRKAEKIQGNGREQQE